MSIFFSPHPTFENPSSVSSTCPLSFLSRRVETVFVIPCSLSVVTGASPGCGDAGSCAEFVAVVAVVVVVVVVVVVGVVAVSISVVFGFGGGRGAVVASSFIVSKC